MSESNELNVSETADAEIEKLEAEQKAEVAERRANVIINMLMAYAQEYPHQSIALMSEVLVNVTTQLIKASGGDPDAGIQLQGGSRGLTIHPVPQGVLEA